MRLQSKWAAVLIIWGLALVTVLLMYIFGRKAFRSISSGESASSNQAFKQTYLNAAEGRAQYQKTTCNACHPRPDIYDDDKWATLENRFQLEPKDWAKKIQLTARCGSCHVVPDPTTLASKAWIESIDRMDEISKIRGLPPMTQEERMEALHYYLILSPGQLPKLPPDPGPANFPIEFVQSTIGTPLRTEWRERPVIGQVKMIDLDRDTNLDLLVCDTDNSKLNWIHRQNREWIEETIASIPFPGHAEVITNATGSLDIVLACQTVMAPTDEPVGSVVLLQNNGQMQFTPRTLVQKISRLSEVQPADFDSDGDTDFLVAVYGHLKVGELAWLENKSNEFTYRLIVTRAGAIHVPLIDLDADGRIDFIALFAQEHEQISAFLNRGNSIFEEKVLFKAATPSFGSSGIRLFDLDQDGDSDILYTNGDNMDLKTVNPRPYHGVQWLENKGSLQFTWHNIHRFYGAYSAVPGDLNRDGKLDLVVTSMFNDWDDPKRASLIWLENDGSQQFKAHTIARDPIYLICADLGDLDKDGDLDIVASGMHAFPPFDRMGRVTFWKNPNHTPR